jgi:hypothetical protein
MRAMPEDAKVFRGIVEFGEGYRYCYGPYMRRADATRAVRQWMTDTRVTRYWIEQASPAWEELEELE